MLNALFVLQVYPPSGEEYSSDGAGYPPSKPGHVYPSQYYLNGKARARTHTHTHTQTHTNTHTDTHKHTHSHTHTQRDPQTHSQTRTHTQSRTDMTEKPGERGEKDG